MQTNNPSSSDSFEKKGKKSGLNLKIPLRSHLVNQFPGPPGSYHAMI